jgi:hypothetical protein
MARVGFRLIYAAFSKFSLGRAVTAYFCFPGGVVVPVDFFFFFFFFPDFVPEPASWAKVTATQV